jgi:VWFA-related protein
MSTPKSLRGRVFAIVMICLTTIGTSALGQQKPNPPPADEIVRINSELVQTSVAVFDKSGNFVEGLKPEQFELRVDGRSIPVSFLERVTAGTVHEEQLITKQFARVTPGTTTVNSNPATYRGRTIVFFIDDLHLSSESVERTRKTILEFVDNQMGFDDQVAIASASGQIGFLQQFTDVSAVLRAAIARLSYRPYTVRDSENIPMTEYTALQIDQGDKFALEYYSSELLKATNSNAGGGLGPPRSGPYGGRPEAGQTPGITRDVADRFVKERAQRLLRQSAAVTSGTLSTLESLMRTSSHMPGRKIVFFVSDGFYLNDRNTGFGETLRQITDAATRGGTVIYSIDARGLMSMVDASSNRADPAGLVSRSNTGEITASQDALTALASDTGGRSSLNTGALASIVSDALRETSNYYLMGWRPAAADLKGGSFKRIEVSIVGRPDLTVRLPRGFILAAAAKPGGAVVIPAVAKGPEPELRSALSAPSARRDLPLSLAVSFLDVPATGPVITVSTQMATDVLGYGADGKQPAAIDLMGVVLNDQGKQASMFKTRVNVNPSTAPAPENPGVIYSHRLPMPPGLYQVRVAARDDRSGKTGSAANWIEVPNLKAARLTLSTLLLGGQFIGAKEAPGGEQMQFSVDRRFRRDSHLNFLTIIYNAAGSKPGLEAQIQISRNGQVIVTSPVSKVVTDANTDLARVFYGADIALKSFAPGRYRLRVNISDRIANTSASREISFEVE